MKRLSHHARLWEITGCHGQLKVTRASLRTGKLRLPMAPHHCTIAHAGLCQTVLVVLCLVGAAVPAMAREPLDLIPADSLLCWYGQPLPDTNPAPDQPSTLQTLLELGTRLAGRSLDSGTQLGVRGAEMFGLMIRYPHALALIDVLAKPVETDPNAKRMDRLRFVLVVQMPPATAGPDQGQAGSAPASRPADQFLRLIQKTVNEQTDSGTATLANKKAGPWTYQELRDRRLPDWATIAWGHIDDHFVLTVGDDVWPNIAAVANGDSPAMSADQWYGTARRDCGHKPLIEIFVAARRIQERLDPLLDGRASEFFRTWDAGDMDRAHWALGLDGRALFCLAHFRMAGTSTEARQGDTRPQDAGRDEYTVRRVYADAGFGDARLLAVVPPEARYAVYHLPMGRLLSRLFSGLLATQTGKQRENIERIWADIQAQPGFDVQRNLLDHLGDYVILHNDPPHPLRIPLAVTTLTEIREAPGQVRQTIDTMCNGFRAAMEKAVEEGRAPLPWALQRDDDGVWFLQFGPVAGPAWVVTERFIVTSWSPRALREYLDKVGAAVGNTAP